MNIRKNIDYGEMYETLDKLKPRLAPCRKHWNGKSILTGGGNWLWKSCGTILLDKSRRICYNGAAILNETRTNHD